jgi:hypothetical protein
VVDTYRVVFKGAQPGRSLDEIKDNLVRLFRVRPEQVMSLTNTPGSVVKRGIDLQTANRYQAAMQEAGCICVIESGDSAPGMSANTSNAAPTTSQQPVMTKQILICSNCATTNPDSAKFCASCGSKLDAGAGVAISETSVINSTPTAPQQDLPPKQKTSLVERILAKNTQLKSSVRQAPHTTSIDEPGKVKRWQKTRDSRG